MKRLLLVPILLLGFVSYGQYPINGAGSYSQNFDALLNTGTANPWVDNSTIQYWYSQRTGTGTTYRADNGSGNAGALYSFGTTAATDRAIGSLGSSNAAAGHFAHGVQFQNTGTTSVANFQISYTMEQWRVASATANTLTFWYKVSSSAITALTPNTSTGWTAVTALDATSPILNATAAALDGNLAANRVVLTNVAIPGLTLAPGEYLMLRWDDPDHAGSDQGLSIDNFSASWTTSCNTTSTINVSACSSYTVPSGEETYMASGVYHDTIPNAAMCDSIITINLNITGGTTSSFSVTSCTSYTVPSGDEIYYADGVYMDTIPNYMGCDSVMTITVDIVAGITYYADTDMDGLGDPANTQVACSQPGGYVTNSNDCNDNNASIGAATVWYADTDGDTYGDAAVTMTNCTQPGGYVANSLDCNDANAGIHPGATEIAGNGIDEDCSGADLVPASLGQYLFTNHACATPVLNATSVAANVTFGDYSANGAITCALGVNYINYSGWNQTTTVDPTQYYSFTITPASCYGMNLTELHFMHRVSASGIAPVAHVRSSLDNFATDIATLPITVTATDINEVVTLPSGQFGAVNTPVEFRFYITEMGAAGATYRHDNVSVFGLLNTLPAQTFYADLDGDTYGDPSNTTSACSAPAGYVSDNTDCDDTDANEHPGAVWAIDADNDGFAGATTMISCTQPANHIPASSPADCDDSDNMVGAPSVTYYADLDGDMYGDPNSPVLGCAIQVGYSPNNLDCDDTDASINPDAVEICDGIDNNCDGNIDEGLLNVAYYEDADGDGFGNSNSMISDCAQPAGYVTVGGDCDDTDDTINPDADDVLGDGIDQNCDGVDGYLSIEENVYFEIKASPNPGNTFVRVTVSESFGTTGVEMIAADGRVVNVPFSTVEGGVEMETVNLVPGMYIIRLSNGSTSTTVRWIKL